MKIILVYPPGNTDISQPYTSLSYLTGALKENGHSVTQRDLGLEAIKFFMNPEKLNEYYAFALKRLRQLDKKNRLSFRHQKEYRDLCELLLRGNIIEDYKRAIEIMRDKNSFLDPKQLDFAIRSIGWAFRLVPVGFYPTSWHINGYQQEFDSSKVSSLIKALSNKQENLFMNFFSEQIIPDLLKEKPDVLGISISFMRQLIPGLTLAKMIKEKDREIHICLGGTVLMYMTDVLQRSKELFSFFDSVILYEGETALSELLERLRTDRNLKKVPNMIFYNGKRIIRSDKIHIEDINLLPSPCFDGLHLEDYITPEKIIVLNPSRGCYWNKCAFCGMSPTLRLKYRERKPELFLKDIICINKKYGVNSFSFNSDIISPGWLVKISDLIIENKLSIKWDSEVRLEKGFTENVCNKLYSAGCVYLRFGFESGNQRVLDLMHKGITLKKTKEIIENCYRAQIRVGLEAFVGFPGETTEEAEDTLNFIINNNGKIGSVVIGTFDLVKYSPVYESPETFGVEIIKSNSIIQYEFNYRVKAGISQVRAQQLINDFSQRLYKFSHLFKKYNNACGSSYSILYAAHYKTDKISRDRGENKKEDNISESKFKSPFLHAAILRFNLNKISKNIHEGNLKQPLFPEKQPFLVLGDDDTLHFGSIRPFKDTFKRFA